MERAICNICMKEILLSNESHLCRYVLDRVPKGAVEVILSYCHYSLNDTSLLELVPYLQDKGVGIISASPLSMGLLSGQGYPEWHPAPPELKVCGSSSLST